MLQRRQPRVVALAVPSPRGPVDGAPYSPVPPSPFIPPTHRQPGPGGFDPGPLSMREAAIAWFAAIPNLPCRLPAGEECPPEDDAAKLVPGDALAYAHANVDPATDQFAGAAAIERTGMGRALDPNSATVDELIIAVRAVHDLAGSPLLRSIAEQQSDRPGPAIAYELLTTRDPATSSGSASPSRSTTASPPPWNPFVV